MIQLNPPQRYDQYPINEDSCPNSMPLDSYTELSPEELASQIYKNQINVFFHIGNYFSEAYPVRVLRNLIQYFNPSEMMVEEDRPSSVIDKKTNDLGRSICLLAIISSKIIPYKP